MRIVTDEKDRQAYKEFLEKHERCNFQQSPEWAKVKGNWINEIVLAEDESGKIIGAVSILIRKIPIFGNIMYSSRGPTCDIHDISVMKQLTDGIKELAKKYKAIVYKAEPDILSSDEEYRKIVTSLGYKIKETWTWQRTKDLLITLLIIAVICTILWFLPPTHKMLVDIYESNPIIKIIVNIIVNIVTVLFKTIVALFQNLFMKK